MADNVPITAGSGTNVAAKEVTFSGDTTQVQVVDLAHVVGTEGARTLAEVFFAEDAAHTSGDYGMQLLTVRQNTAAALSGADADYQPLITDTNGRLHVIEPSAAAALTALQLLDNAVYVDGAAWTNDTSSHFLVGGVYQTTPQTITDGDTGPLQVNANGILKVIGVDANGDALTPIVDDAAFTVATDSVAVMAAVATTDSVDSGDAGAVAMTLTRALHVAPKMQSTGGWSSHHRNIDANAETEVKGSAGTIGWVHAVNLTAAIAYLHIYDQVAASVTPGTTTPNFTFPIPTAGNTNGGGFNLNFGTQGHSFATGITYVVTTTVDGSAGDPGTNGVMVNIGYI